MTKADDASESWDQMATVGRIVRPQGNRGQVVVESATDFGQERFQTGAALFIERGHGVERVEVTESRPHDHRWVIGLDIASSINDAEALRGLELRIYAAELKTLDAGTFYVHDLVGCRVETVGGQTVGTVERVDVAVGTPVLVVIDARNGTTETLVPLAEEICRRIDVAGRIVVIDPPEGLLALNAKA